MFAEDIVPNNATSATITKETSGLVLTGLEVDPRELYFGAMIVGEDPMVKTATVKNIGRRTLRINSVVLETDSDQFTMQEAHPNLLKSGESFTVTVNYAGDQPTLVTGVIYVTTNEDRDPYRILLSGRVLASLYIQEQFDDFYARLEQESWARADADSAEAGQRLLLQASLRDEIEATILVERIARVTAIEAEAVSREILSAVVYDNYAELTDEKLVRATADDAMAQRINTLEATVGDGLEEVDVRSWIQEEATVRANADEAEAIARQSLGAEFETAINDTQALITQEATARADADAAQATTTDALSASLEAAIGNIGGLATAVEALSVSVEEVDGVLTSQASQINTLTVSAYSTGNLIPNSELLDVTGWALGANSATPSSIIESTPVSNPAWCATGGGFSIVQSGASDGSLTTYSDVYLYPEYSAVEGGKRYQYSAFAGAHRANGLIYVAWYSGTDAYISSSDHPATASIAAGEKSGGKSLDDFKRIGGFVNAPANAVRARLVLRKYNTLPGQTSSYLFVEQPMLARARPGQTELDPYMAGVPIKNLTASITDARTIAVNTKGEVDAMWRFQVTAGYKIVGMKLGIAGGVAAVDFTTDWFRISLPDGSGTKQVFTVGPTSDGGYGVGINGSLMINGSLTIRAADGTVILHSGSSVQSQIAPYEWGATAGATIGGNLFGQFNGSNIGTYMANAAIGYLQLAGGAVSVSNAASFALAIGSIPGAAASAAVSIPANGFITISLRLRANLSGYLVSLSPYSAHCTIYITLSKNGSPIASWQEGFGSANRAAIQLTGSVPSAAPNCSVWTGGLYDAKTVMVGRIVNAAPGDVFTASVNLSGGIWNPSSGAWQDILNIDEGFLLITGSYR